MPLNIAIVGTGLTGLVAAYGLSNAGCRVTLFEEMSGPGGLASSFNAGQEQLERFYHHIFTGDQQLLELCDKLGIGDRLEWFEPRNAIYLGNHLFPFTSPMDLLRFSPLKLVSRVRTGLLALTSPFIHDYLPYESVTARDWLIKRAGKDSYDKIWGPLLNSKFDKDADSVSGVWIWNKLKLRGSSRDKNLRKEQLGYMKGGFSTLVSRLEEEILANGGVFRYNTKITDINLQSDGSFTIGGGSKDEVFDKVLFTASPQVLGAMPSPLPADFNDALTALKTKANICLTLELEQSLSPYYWITVAQEEIPFVLVIEHTRLVGLRDYKSHVVYLSRYIDASSELYGRSDNEIEEVFIKGLSKIFPDFKSDSIRKATLSRAKYAQPVVVKGYSKMIPPVRTPVDGLYLASMSQIYPEDRGMNYAVRLGVKAVKEIMRSV